jgi:hypothetical protein
LDSILFALRSARRRVARIIAARLESLLGGGRPSTLGKVRREAPSAFTPENFAQKLA